MGIFKMIARLVLISYITVFYSTAQIVVDDNDAPAEGLEGDVDTRFFNIDFGTIDLGQVAGTALGTTLGQLGTGFLNDCLGIGKRSVIMDKLVNKPSAQEVSDDPSVDSRIIGEDDVNNRIFCLNQNNGYNNGGGFGGGFGGNRPSCNTLVTVVQVMLIVAVVAAVIQVAVDLVTNVTVVTEGAAAAVALPFLKQEVILQIQTVVLPKIIMMQFNLVMHNFLLKSLECCF